MKRAPNPPGLNEEQIVRRRDAALRRALNMPPQHKRGTPRPKPKRDDCIEELSGWEGRVVREVADLAFSLARGTPGEWGMSILVPHSLFVNETLKGVCVAGCICRAAVPGELVRVDFDSLDDVARGERIRVTFRRFPRPRIEGVGDLIVEDTPEGVVILRRE